MWGIVLLLVATIQGVNALHFLPISGVPELYPHDPTWTARYYFVVFSVGAVACFMSARTRLTTKRTDDEVSSGRA
jgi:hypothetical protein